MVRGDCDERCGSADPGSTLSQTPPDQADAGRVAELEAELAATREQLHAAWGQIQSMRHSTSWRLTWPLRAVRRWIR